MDLTESPDLPDLAPLRDEVQQLPVRARTLELIDEASVHAASVLLRRIKKLRTHLTLFFTPHIQRAFAAHRALVEDRRQLDAPLAEAETRLKERLGTFLMLENGRRAAAARRETAANQTARTDGIWRDVETLEGAGQHDDAAELVAEFLREPALVVMPAQVLRPEGIRMCMIWRYDVIAPDEIPREYLMIDHQKLGAVVRALKGTATIPGVRMWAEHTVAVTGK
jgi:hypothetical protein